MTNAIGPAWAPAMQPRLAPAPASAPALAPVPHERATAIAPNPSLRFDPTLGMVVFELRDSAGEVTRSMPTEHELRAYRTAALRGEGAPAAEVDQTRNPPGRMPSSANALDVPAEVPNTPPASLARLTR